MGRLLESLPVERHDTLIARQVATLFDRESQMAVAQQRGRSRLAGGLRCGEAFGVEAREGAQAVGRVKIDDEHVHRAVAARLQLEAPLDLERSAKQHRQCRRLAKQPRDTCRIGMTRQDRIDGRPQPHHAPAHIQRLNREWQRDVVKSEI